MKHITYYENYTEFKESLQNKTYDLSFDSVGRYDRCPYSADITVRDYDGNRQIDFDVYDKPLNLYLDGGKICDVTDIPDTDDDFWKLVVVKVEDYIMRIKND